MTSNIEGSLTRLLNFILSQVYVKLAVRSVISCILRHFCLSFKIQWSPIEIIICALLVFDAGVKFEHLLGDIIDQL